MWNINTPSFSPPLPSYSFASSVTRKGSMAQGRRGAREKQPFNWLKKYTMFPGLTITLHKTIQVMQIQTKLKGKGNGFDDEILYVGLSSNFNIAKSQSGV